ncbi:hypothetical protein V8C86DRAFT_2667809, partial [Haematococcus lacustris]
VHGWLACSSKRLNRPRLASADGGFCNVALLWMMPVVSGILPGARDCTPDMYKTFLFRRPCQAPLHQVNVSIWQGTA